MHQHVGHAALERVEAAELGVGGIEPLDQLDDAVFQAAQRELVALAQVHAVEPLVERMDEASRSGGRLRPLSISDEICDSSRASD